MPSACMPARSREGNRMSILGGIVGAICLLVLVYLVVVLLKGGDKR